MIGLRAMIEGASWSGKERNHLFLNLGGEQFEDVSGLSGLDHAADGRSFAVFDMDRDGFQDFAVVNTNDPRILIYRNGIGDSQKAGGARSGFVALRFHGGNTTASPSSSWSARDGYGAQVQVTAGGAELIREYRCGEGLAAQNSATMVVGLGHATAADSLVVRWPSGIEQRLDDVPSGRLITVYENPVNSPTGKVFVLSDYDRISWPPSPASDTASDDAAAQRLVLDRPALSDAPAALNLYTTTATWCASCKGRLPQLARLRDGLGADQLAMWGLPSDEKETPALFDAYRDTYAPAYELLRDISPAERQEVRALLGKKLLNEAALPASIVTDADGNILLVDWGVPSLSQMRELLEKATRS